LLLNEGQAAANLQLKETILLLTWATRSKPLIIAAILAGEECMHDMATWTRAMPKFLVWGFGR